MPSMVKQKVQRYFNRMQGQRFDPSRYAPKGPTPPSRPIIMLSTFLTSFIGIAITASLTYNSQWFIERNTPVMTGAFGASAVLIYGAIDAPLSQPRNVFCGHIMSAVVGVSMYKLFHLMDASTLAHLQWLLCALSVSISLFLMQLTQTVHPPASATALIAVTGGEQIYNLGYWYVLCPVALGITLMLTVALLGNNIARRYPMHWWSAKARTITVVNQDMSAVIADLVSQSDDDLAEEGDGCCVDSEVAGHAEDSDSGDNLSTRVASQVETTKESSLKNGTLTTTESRSPVISNAQTPVHSRPISTVGSPGQHHSRHLQHARHHHHHHHGGEQYAIFYEGELHKDLENGEIVHARRPSAPGHGVHETGNNNNINNALHIDLEHGLTPRSDCSPHCCHHRAQGDLSSMRVQTRGSALNIEPEEYQRVIHELQTKVHELEQELGRRQQGGREHHDLEVVTDSNVTMATLPSELPRL
ncbi:hypothetical protein BGZ73_008624 [Actinomortierella ambigua]|nr:hypothetical protein BGZ73_008624 [Actinomortierella ambigua]